MPSPAVRYPLLALAVSCSFGVLGCSADDAPSKSSQPPSQESSEKKPLVPLYAGAPAFCEREGADAVRDVFCGEEPPKFRGLAELESALGIVFGSTDSYESASSGVVGLADQAVSVVLSHSTALGGDVVSPINPRAILIGGGSVLAFNRGAQQVEIASNALLPRDLPASL
jgi:hypothetical protein